MKYKESSTYKISVLPLDGTGPAEQKARDAILSINAKIPHYGEKGYPVVRKHEIDGKIHASVGGLFALATQDDSIVGYLLSSPDTIHADSLQITMTGVMPEHQDKGIFRSLVEETEVQARSSGYETITAKVRNKHEAVRYVLDTRGYLVSSVVPKWDTREHRIVYQKPLLGGGVGVLSQPDVLIDDVVVVSNADMSLRAAAVSQGYDISTFRPSEHIEESQIIFQRRKAPFIVDDREKFLDTVLSRNAPEIEWGAFGSGLEEYEKEFSWVLRSDGDGKSLPFDSIQSYCAWRRSQTGREVVGGDMFGQAVPFADMQVRAFGNGLSDPYKDGVVDHTRKDLIDMIVGDSFSQQTHDDIRAWIKKHSPGGVDVFLCRPAGPFMLSSEEEYQPFAPFSLDAFRSLISFYYEQTADEGLILTQFPKIYHEYVSRMVTTLEEVGVVSKCHHYLEDKGSKNNSVWMMWKKEGSPPYVDF